MTTITTGEDGMAVAENLPLGAYRVVEKTAPEGFVLNPDAAEVVFVYEGQDTPVVEQEVTVGDERQKVAITVEKQDAENGAVVANLAPSRPQIRPFTTPNSPLHDPIFGPISAIFQFFRAKI